MIISSQGPEGMILGGRYRIIRLIGSGGMANVYLASDMTSGINVAIKVLKPEFTADEEFIKRFDTEAKAASSLSHPNIVRVLGVGQEGEFRYMVQEFVDGITVKELIAQSGPLDWRVAVPIAIQVGMALDHAHQHGIVHRDIKPHNILITRDRIAKVTDFGIARAATSNTITLTSGGALGSVHYFSPEQARGAMVGPSTDIYSLGVLLFEMLTGRVPFDGDTPVAIAIKHLQEQPPSASGFAAGIPAGLDAIILKSMQKSVDFRYATVHEMVSELDALMVDPNGAYGIISVSNIAEAPTGQMQAMRHDPNYSKLRDIEHSIDKRRRSRTKDNVLVILLVTVIIGVLLSAVFLVSRLVLQNLSGGSNDSFTVGEYVGKSINDVESELKSQDFTDYTISYAVSADYDPGIVTSQSIKAGVVIKPGNGLHTLELVVSVSGNAITLPNYAGLDQASVQNDLAQKGLTFTVRPESSGTVAAGMVIRTEPGAGSSVMPGGEVAVYVSQGVTAVTIPSLAGLSLTTAKQMIQENGLILGNVTVQPGAQNLSENEQYVITSDPAKDTVVNPKSSINLVVGTYEDYINSSYGITPTPTPVSYQLTILSAEGGSATGAGTYAEGSQVTVIATPNGGYTFTVWKDDSGADFGKTGTLTFTMPSRNLTLTPVFAKEAKQYAVVIDSAEGGSAVQSGSGTYPEGTEVTVTATADDGFQFVSWKIYDKNGKQIDESDSPSYTFTISGDVTVQPAFAASASGT